MVRLVPVDDAPEAAAGGETPNTFLDVLLSAGAGVRRGAEATIGLPGDAAKGMRWSAEQVGRLWGSPVDRDYIAGKRADGQERGDLAWTPTSDEVKKASTETFGDSHKPQTTAGEFAHTVGEFVPGAFVGGAGAAANLPRAGRFLAANAVIPGTASEAAGQLTEDTELEPAARVLGALFGGQLGQATTPRTAMTGRQAERADVAADSATAGVKLPSFMMPDAPGQRSAARRLADIPLIGDPVRNAARTTSEKMGARTDELARAMGNTDMATVAGQTTDALHGYQTTAMPAASKTAYDAVDQAITDPHRLTSLANTRALLRTFRNEMDADTTRTAQPIVDLLNEAANNRKGLTYEALKRLRTTVGSMQDDALAPNSQRAAAKRAYGALSDDLERAVRNAGGQAAHDAWTEANDLHRGLRETSEHVDAVAGVRGQTQPDQVMARVLKLAEAHDTTRLSQLQRAIREHDTQVGTGRDSWGDMAAATLHQLGRHADDPNSFDPNAFAKSYRKLSPTGREMLFPDADHRRTLDALARLADRFEDVREPSRNQLAMAGSAYGMFGAGAVLNPMLALSGALSGHVLARILARPAGAQKVLSVARAANAAKGTGANAYAQAVQALAEEAAQETGEDPKALFKRIMEMR